MKEIKQIRRGAFESNSSSSHSLTVSNKGEYKSNIPVLEHYKGSQNCVVLTGGEFGWGYDDYNDAFSKANYLAVYLQGYANNDYFLNMFESLIKKETGATNIIYDLGDSYIDHQSSEDGEEVFDSEQKLKDFIFNTQSELVIDNDNH